MKFPGSKLLHEWDLSVQKMSLDDLLDSCQRAGLTGLAEVRIQEGVGLILYYMGGEINALFREGVSAHNGQAALERLRARSAEGAGSVSVFELPLDMAHLLRGMTNRRRLKERVRSRSEFEDVLRGLEKSEHTGTLEIQAQSGAAMVLLVRGRVSNVYWEARGGLTYEKGEARQKLDEAMGPDDAILLLSDFSRDVWKTRHEVQAPAYSRLERKGDGPRQAPETLASEETQARQKALDQLTGEVPAILLAFFFDLMTGAVFARSGRGASDVDVKAAAEALPVVALLARDRLTIAEESETMEFLAVETNRLSFLVHVVAEAQEAIGVVADRALPTAQAQVVLARVGRAHADRLRPLRTQ